MIPESVQLGTLAIPVLSVASLAAFVSLRLGIRIETAVASVLCGIMGILFVAAMLRVLPAAPYAIALLAAAAAPAVAYKLIKRDRWRIEPIRLFWFASLAAIFILFVWLYQRAELYLWDDFSYWARATKFITLEQRLFDATSNWITVKYYPPGMALLHYFFLKFTGYSEPNVICVQFLITLAIIAAIVSPISQRSPSLGILSVSLIVLCAYLLEFSFDNTTVDILLGLLLGAMIIVALTERSVAGILFAIAALCVALVLLKQTGFPFALFGVIISLVILAVRTRVLSALRAAPSLLISRGTGLAIGAALAIPLLVLLTQFAWQQYSSSIGGGSATVAPISALRDLYSGIVNGTASPRTVQTFDEFGRRLIKLESFQPMLFGIPGRFSLPPIGMFLALLLLNLIAVFLLPKGKRGPALAAAILLPAALLAYTALLMLLYLGHFTEYEGVRLASFERYLASYFLGWIAISLVLLAPALLRSSRPLAIFIALLGFGTVLLAARPLEKRIAVIAEHRAKHVTSARREVRALASAVTQVAARGDRIFFIKQGDTGFGIYAFQFEMMYHRIQDGCWAFGKPYLDHDAWTCDAKLLEDLIQGYSFLVIALADQQFWSLYSEHFDSADRGLTSGIFRVLWRTEKGKKQLAFERVRP